MGGPKPLSSPRPLSQNRASEQRAALLPRGPGAAAPGALSPAFSRESGTPPHGQWPPRSGILRISCLYDRHYLTLLVTAALSDQRGWSSPVPPTRWQAFSGRLLPSPPTAAPLRRWQRRLSRAMWLVVGALTNAVGRRCSHQRGWWFGAAWSGAGIWSSTVGPERFDRCGLAGSFPLRRLRRRQNNG